MGGGAMSSAETDLAIVRKPPCEFNLNFCDLITTERRFGTSKMRLSPQWLRLLSVLRRPF